MSPRWPSAPNVNEAFTQPQRTTWRAVISAESAVPVSNLHSHRRQLKKVLCSREFSGFIPQFKNVHIRSTGPETYHHCSVHKGAPPDLHMHKKKGLATAVVSMCRYLLSHKTPRFPCSHGLRLGTFDHYPQLTTNKKGLFLWNMADVWRFIYKNTQAPFKGERTFLGPVKYCRLVVKTCLDLLSRFRIQCVTCDQPV